MWFSKASKDSLGSKTSGSAAGKIREHYVFTGFVQGVGFRYRAKYICQSLDLTGWVENIWDGSVEMEVQGSRESIQKMLEMLNEQNYIEIEHYECTRIPVEAGEYSFRIR